MNQMNTVESCEYMSMDIVVYPYSYYNNAILSTPVLIILFLYVSSTLSILYLYDMLTAHNAEVNEGQKQEDEQEDEDAQEDEDEDEDEQEDEDEEEDETSDNIISDSWKKDLCPCECVCEVACECKCETPCECKLCESTCECEECIPYNGDEDENNNIPQEETCDCGGCSYNINHISSASDGNYSNNIDHSNKIEWKNIPKTPYKRYRNE